MKMALMMEIASTSETSVNFYQTTRRYNPEDSHLAYKADNGVFNFLTSENKWAIKVYATLSTKKLFTDFHFLVSWDSKKKSCICV
jgi:hypothetical protein